MGDGPNAFYQLRWAVHKTTNAVAVTGGGYLREVRQLCAFASRADILREMVERL
jgi:hypothetical protein